MENQEYTKRNQELFAELAKYPEDSKEYQKIVSAIVKNNVRLVTSVAKKYLPVIKSTTISLDDLISEGCFGLMEAVKPFKLEKGVTFATYAVYRIKGHILDYLRREIRRLTNYSLEDDKDGDERKIEDDLLSPVNIEEDFAEKDERNRQMAWIRKNLDQLPPLQRDVLISRYLSGETMTNEALAEKFGCTHQNVSAAERKAFKKLRKIYYASHPEEIKTKEAVELTTEEKIKLKEVLKNLIATELTPMQKKTMLCKFYSATEKTNEQIAQEFDSTKKYISHHISMSYKKLCTLCDSIQDKNHLKSILEFRTAESGIAR